MFNAPPYQPYPMYQPPMMDNLAQMKAQPQQSGMIWVQGEAAAKSYLVAAGNTVPLWDSENTCIYVKTVDASGIPTMRVLDYTERQPMPKPTQSEYVTRAEFDALAAKIAALSNNEEVKTDG